MGKRKNSPELPIDVRVIKLEMTDLAQILENPGDAAGMLQRLMSGEVEHLAAEPKPLNVQIAESLIARVISAELDRENPIGPADVDLLLANGIAEKDLGLNNLMASACFRWSQDERGCILLNSIFAASQDPAVQAFHDMEHSFYEHMHAEVLAFAKRCCAVLGDPSCKPN